jgi:hypothetical protein
MLNFLRNKYKKIRFHLYWQKHRYIDDYAFIHIPKTGGTSIEVALSIPHTHDRATTIRDWLGVEEYQRRFVFSIVRNPWDITVSLYQFRKENGQISYRSTPSFPEWVRLVYVDKDPRYRTSPWAGHSQSWWLLNEAGEIMVDYVAKLESISEEWKIICNNIGVNIELPHRNKSNRKKYQYYYDDKSRKIIQELYSEDIENFEYEF